MMTKGTVARLVESDAHVSLGDERRRPVFVVLHFDAVRHVLDQKRLLEHGVDQGLLQGVLRMGGEGGRDEGSGKDAVSARQASIDSTRSRFASQLHDYWRTMSNSRQTASGASTIP
jgi:hypothetical protein